MKKIALFLVALTLTCSCSKNKFKPEPFFTLDPVGNLIFPAHGGSQDVQIKTNLLSWEIRHVEMHDWCKIEKDERGAPRFRISAKENKDSVARPDVIIEVVGQNNEVSMMKTMKISQVAAKR